MRTTQWEVTICKPGTKFSPETQLPGTLILDFELPEVWMINFCRPSPRSLWYFVMTAWTNIPIEENGPQREIILPKNEPWKVKEHEYKTPSICSGLRWSLGSFTQCFWDLPSRTNANPLFLLLLTPYLPEPELNTPPFVLPVEVRKHLSALFHLHW